MPGVNLPQRKLVSQEDSSIIKRPELPRSRFTGTFTRKMPLQSGLLHVFLCDEILPGDHVQYDATAYVRMSTPLFPIMDNQRIDTFFFFTPSRILWDHWVNMMGEQADPSSSIDFGLPYIASPPDGFAVASIYDDFGIPTLGQLATGEHIDINALPLRAYNRIFNDWFRDQNSVGSRPVHTDDGPDPYTDYGLRNRAKSHDYFTTALPWPQKFTAPTVPIAGIAPITGIGKADITSVQTGPVPAGETDDYESGSAQIYAKYANFTTAAAGTMVAEIVGPDSHGFYYPAIYADLSQATGVAINTFRQAFMIQTLLERDARGGTRYTELLLNHFGTRNPDYRLQRPEYIGGGQSPLIVTPIAQTAPTVDAPLGALGGAGTASGSHRASYAATEYGYVIGIINVKSEISYQQGLHRMWTRRTRYDFYVPALAQLGEQAVLKREIYVRGSAQDNEVFGYQEHWHEYRTRYSEVTGLFRSTAANTIDPWHLAQKFTSAPALNEAFIADDPPMARVLAAGATANYQQYLADIMIRRNIVRVMPAFSTPVGLGRF